MFYSYTTSLKKSVTNQTTTSFSASCCDYRWSCG